jgi:hypothetical protein
MGLYEIKKLLYNKRNGHQIKELPSELEKIFARYTTNKGLITRMYREFKKLNSPPQNQ